MTMINKEEAIANVKNLLIDESERDYNSGVRDSIRVLRDMIPVESFTTTNPDDYKGDFEESVYSLILHVARLKGIDGAEYTCDSLLEEVCDSIIEVCNNYHLDLSVPDKEYNVGDKVTIYFEGIPQQAIIVNVGYEKYALLLYAKNNVIYISDSVNSATNYIYCLQHDLGINVE